MATAIGKRVFFRSRVVVVAVLALAVLLQPVYGMTAGQTAHAQTVTSLSPVIKSISPEAGVTLYPAGSSLPFTVTVERFDQTQHFVDLSIIPGGVPDGTVSFRYPDTDSAITYAYLGSARHYFALEQPLSWFESFKNNPDFDGTFTFQSEVLSTEMDEMGDYPVLSSMSSEGVQVADTTAPNEPGDGIDMTPPTTTLVAPTGIAGNIFTVSGEASDDVALNRVYVQLRNTDTGIRYGGTTIDLISEGAGPATWSKIYNATELGIPDGLYQAHVEVVDMDGKRFEIGWTASFVLDSIAPTMEIITPASGSIVKGIVRMQAKVTDFSGIGKVLMNIGDSKGWYVWEAGKTDNTLTRDGDYFYVDVDTTAMPDGEYHMVLRGTDNAGNTGYLNNSGELITFVVDNIGPQVTDNFIINMRTGEKMQLSPLVTDISGVASYVWVINGEKKLVKYGQQIDNLAETLTIGPAPKGYYTVTLTVTDNLGNVATATYYVTISTP